MEKIEAPDVEMGTPSMGSKPKVDKEEKPKEEKKEDKSEAKPPRFMTKSKQGNEIRVIGPRDQNRAQRRQSERRFLNSIGKGTEDRAKTSGAFGSRGVNL